MTRSIVSLTIKLRLIQTQTSNTHTSLLNLIHNLESESLPGFPSKIAIDLSTFEEIATIASKLSQQDSDYFAILEDFEKIEKNCTNIWKNAALIRKEAISIKQTLNQESKIIKSQIKQIGSILKEYRDRCRGNFLDYLKGLDLDLRKILKPLVPSNVLNDQVKFPMINNNPSLRSSVAPSHEGTGVIETSQPPQEVENEVDSHPEPSEVANEKLNAHIQMLVGTLENLAKDLIQVVAEADRQYYDLLNKIEVYSRPPTPLAAPLPEYFTFENIDSITEEKINLVDTKKSKIKWKKRLKNLYEQGGMEEWVYKKILKRIDKVGDNEIQVDLQEIFKDIDIPISFRENIAFSLVNSCKIPQQDVSLSDLLREDEEEKSKNSQEIKPEPPKEPKAKSRPFPHKLEKEQEGLEKTIDERLEMVHNTPAVTTADLLHSEIEVHRASPVPRVYQSRNSLPNNKYLSRRPAPPKEPIYKSKKERKEIRVRSITPINKPKEKTVTPRRKTKTPIGKKSINFGHLTPYHNAGW